jgi:hypothetical protein
VKATIFERITNIADFALEITTRTLGGIPFRTGCRLDLAFFEKRGHRDGRNFNRTDEDRKSINGPIRHDDDRPVRLDEFKIGSVQPRLVDAGTIRQSKDGVGCYFYDTFAGWLWCFHRARLCNQDCRLFWLALRVGDGRGSSYWSVDTESHGDTCAKLISV